MQSENKTFCILPFLHLYSDPKGEVKPCCISKGFDNPLNLKNSTISEVFNSSQMKDLRKDMLNNIRNKVCMGCYDREDSTGQSPRITYNDSVGNLWEIPEIYEDFSVPLDFQYIDLRFSNLCNFKCRMCAHDFSSNWYEDSTLVRNWDNPNPKVIKISDTIIDELSPYLSKLKNIYFAGGEPLLMPEHFNLLSYLYDNTKIDKHTNKRNVSIHYNTNLSVIKYDEKNLIELWKGFIKVYLSISCDGYGKVGEYQRTGLNWIQFEKNLNIIKKYATPANIFEALSDINYGFQYTTTIMNVYHIFDFIDYMLDKNHITNSNQIDFYYAWAPYEFSLQNLPLLEKEKVINFLTEKINNYSDKTINELNRIIEFVKMDVQTEGYTPITAGSYIQKIDQLHGGNFYEISKIIL